MRLLHHVLLALSILLAAAAYFVEHERRELLSTVLQFEHAIELTQLRLQYHISTAINDQGIIANVKDNLSNSLRQGLAGKLRDGEIDEFQLLNSQCQAVTRTGTAHIINDGCKESGHFLTKTADGIPVLGYTHPFSSDITSNVSLGGYVLLSTA